MHKSVQFGVSRSKVWIYGTHSCVEALKNPLRIIYEARCTNQEAKMLVQSIRPEVRVGIYGQDNISNVTRHSNHQGIALYCESLPLHRHLSAELLENHSHVLILDQIQDINNIGAIMRSMAATNFTALIGTKKHMPDIEKYGLKSSCGGIEHLTIFQIANLTEAIKLLKKLDYTCVALDHLGRSWEEIEKILGSKDIKIAGIIGSEEHGIRKGVREQCDFLLSLCVNPDFPILNASVAAGIFMHMTMRRQ